MVYLGRRNILITVICIELQSHDHNKKQADIVLLLLFNSPTDD